jgi:hypothetical protein
MYLLFLSGQALERMNFSPDHSSMLQLMQGKYYKVPVTSDEKHV